MDSNILNGVMTFGGFCGLGLLIYLIHLWADKNIRLRSIATTILLVAFASLTVAYLGRTNKLDPIIIYVNAFVFSSVSMAAGFSLILFFIGALATIHDDRYKVAVDTGDVKGLPRWTAEKALKERQYWIDFWTPKSSLEARLQAVCDNLLHLFDNMPRVKVQIVDKPMENPWTHEQNMFDPTLYSKKFSWNWTHAPAYCVADSLVCLKRVWLNSASPEEVEETIRHELVHAWMDWKGLDKRDSMKHGPIFQAKAAEVGVPHSAGYEEGYTEWYRG
jgi:Zn-dependent protease with chaperone function